MKVWLAMFPCFGRIAYQLHAAEPDFVEGFWTSEHTMNVCERSLKALHFLPLPKSDQCCEYSLCGKKPKWLCAWEPV